MLFSLTLKKEGTVQLSVFVILLLLLSLFEFYGIVNVNDVKVDQELFLTVSGWL